LSPASDLLTVTSIAVGGGVSAVVDVRTRTIPNALSGGIAIAGLGLASIQPGSHAIVLACYGALLALVLMLPGHLIGGTGAGDVKLFAAFGTFLGPAGVVTAFLYTAIAGGVLAVGVAYSRGRLGSTVRRTADLVTTRGANAVEIEGATSNNRFAFAPAIACGVLAAALGV
jgi:prepilin peptidase CpaA